MTMWKFDGCGLPNVYLLSGYTVEGQGDDACVSYEDLGGLYEAIAQAVAMRAAPLTGPEFRFLRKRLGLSQDEAGAMVGKTSQAVAKWEKNTAELPLADGNMMRLAWLARFARRRVAAVVDSMVSGRDGYRFDYVFARAGGVWVNQSGQAHLLPMLNLSHAEANSLIERLRSSSANTAQPAGEVKIVGPAHIEHRGTT